MSIALASRLAAPCLVAPCLVIGQVGQGPHHQLLHGVPAHETIVGAAGQRPQLRAGVRILNAHGGRKPAQQRRRGALGKARKAERLRRLVHEEHALRVVGGLAGERFAVKGDGQMAPIAQQTHREGYHQGLFLILAGRWRGVLGEGQRVDTGRRVPGVADRQLGRAGLRIPALEGGQIPARGGFHGGDKVIAGHRLAIVALEVEVAAGAKTRRAEQGLQHAHHLGAFLVHGEGVEVRDLDKGSGPHRVRHGSGILGELQGAHHPGVFNALQVPRPAVRGELGVAKNRKTLFQAELKPVAAGDPVARPVVEVLVGHDRLNTPIARVRGGVRVRQHTGGIENIEALVLHGPHVEIIHRHDMEHIEVVLAAEALLVPAHGVFQGRHGVAALGHILFLDQHAQAHLAAAPGGEAILDAGEIAGDQSEQVAGLGEGVFPHRPMPAVAQRLAGDEIAVAEQYRAVRKIGVDGDAVARHYVGTIGEPGDLAKTLGLTLRAEQPSRAIQPLQGGVVLGPDADPGFEHAPGGRRRDTQALGLERVGLGGQRGAVEAHFEGFEGGPVQFQGGLGRRPRGALEVQPGAHRDAVVAQVEMQLYTPHPIRRGRVIVAVNSAGDSAHRRPRLAPAGGARARRHRMRRAHSSSRARSSTQRSSLSALAAGERGLFTPGFTALGALFCAPLCT